MKKTAKKSARRAPAKRRASRARDDMRPEYDFTGAVRGKYAARFQAGTNLILLDPDVAEAFHDSAAVRLCIVTRSSTSTGPTPFSSVG